MRQTIKVKVFDTNRSFELGDYSSPFSSGRDVKAAIPFPLRIPSQTSVLVPTNLCVEIPERYIRKVPKMAKFGEIFGPGALNDSIYNTSNIEYVNQDMGFQLELQVRAKSGISRKKQLIITNGFGTIDADYRGEIMVSLTNVGHNETTIYPGEEIAQLVLAPVLQFDWDIVDELSETERNDRGFGEMTEAKKKSEEIPKVMDLSNLPIGLSSSSEILGYIANMNSYHVYASIGFCIKCGKLKLQCVPNDEHDDHNIAKLECSDCGFIAKYDHEIYPKHFEEHSVQAYAYLRFQPKYPSLDEVLNRIQELESQGRKFNEKEKYYLINHKI